MNKTELKKSVLQTEINLIPKAEGPNGNYFCTWAYQAVTAAKLGLKGERESALRDALDQEKLFGSENYYHPVEIENRKELIFLLDDGWDVPYGTENRAEHWSRFGSVIPDSEKFRSFGNTPLERLKGISAEIKERGYAGLGLWIAPRQCGTDEYSEAEARYYWEERARRCHEAGVLYWKVDWGRYYRNDEYRELMSEAVYNYAPELTVEHAFCQQPVTVLNPEEDFLKKRIAQTRRQMEFSDVFRTYDVIAPFENVSTLQRASEALTSEVPRKFGAKGLVNAESQAVIAASLGLTVGVMKYDSDIRACLNSHRIAPPFGIHACSCLCSAERLTDSFFFEKNIDSWIQTSGETVYESAPAIISRGCPLPEVKKCGAYAPFVTASKNPETNAYSVAAICRAVDPNPSSAFPADVTLKEVDINAPIGIFGIFNSLTVNFTEELTTGCRLLAQELTADSAVDVTGLVRPDGARLVLDGKLLRMWGKRNRALHDTSTPSVMLKICR